MLTTKEHSLHRNETTVQQQNRHYDIQEIIVLGNLISSYIL